MGIKFHNDETELGDGETFNAEQILKEAVDVHGLNSDYFVASKESK